MSEPKAFTKDDLKLATIKVQNALKGYAGLPTPDPSFTKGIKLLMTDWSDGVEEPAIVFCQEISKMITTAGELFALKKTLNDVTIRLADRAKLLDPYPQKFNIEGYDTAWKAIKLSAGKKYTQQVATAWGKFIMTHSELQPTKQVKSEWENEYHGLLTLKIGPKIADTAATTQTTSPMKALNALKAAIETAKYPEQQKHFLEFVGEMCKACEALVKELSVL